MNHRALGRSGLYVSEISLGSWTTYGGSVGASEARRIIHRAFELGINLFDTADVYAKGEAERVLGAAIRELPREQLVIATKAMGRMHDGPLGRGLSRKHLFDALDASLLRLGLEYVDLYQFHAPDDSTPIEESMRAMEDLVCSGKVRYAGFSNFDHQPKLAARAMVLQKQESYTPLISSQPRWNLLDRHVEKEHVAFCKRNGLGLLVYSPLAQGVLTNKYAGGARPEGSRATNAYGFFLTQEKALTDENVAAAERFAAWCAGKGLETAPTAIAWVLNHDVVSSAIVGATTVEQLEQNLKACDVKLSAAEWREAEAAIAGSRAPAKRAAAPKRAAKPAAKAAKGTKRR